MSNWLKPEEHSPAGEAGNYGWAHPKTGLYYNGVWGGHAKAAHEFGFRGDTETEINDNAVDAGYTRWYVGNDEIGVHFNHLHPDAPKRAKEILAYHAQNQKGRLLLADTGKDYYHGTSLKDAHDFIDRVSSGRKETDYARMKRELGESVELRPSIHHAPEIGVLSYDIHKDGVARRIGRIEGQHLRPSDKSKLFISDFLIHSKYRGDTTVARGVVREIRRLHPEARQVSGYRERARKRRDWVLPEGTTPRADQLIWEALHEDDHRAWISPMGDIHHVVDGSHHGWIEDNEDLIEPHHWAGITVHPESSDIDWEEHENNIHNVACRMLDGGWIRKAAKDAYDVGKKEDFGRVLSHVRAHHPEVKEVHVYDRSRADAKKLKVWSFGGSESVDGLIREALDPDWERKGYAWRKSPKVDRELHHAVRKAFASKTAYKIIDSDPEVKGCTWTAGGCAVAAQALHKVLGGKLRSLRSPDGAHNHAVLLHPNGKYYDADGEHTEQEMMDKLRHLEGVKDQLHVGDFEMVKGQYEGHPATVDSMAAHLKRVISKSRLGESRVDILMNESNSRVSSESPKVSESLTEGFSPDDDHWHSDGGKEKIQHLVRAHRADVDREIKAVGGEHDCVTTAKAWARKLHASGVKDVSVVHGRYLGGYSPVWGDTLGDHSWVQHGKHIFDPAAGFSFSDYPNMLHGKYAGDVWDRDPKLWESMKGSTLTEGFSPDEAKKLSVKLDPEMEGFDSKYTWFDIHHADHGKIGIINGPITNGHLNVQSMGLDKEYLEKRGIHTGRDYGNWWSSADVARDHKISANHLGPAGIRQIMRELKTKHGVTSVGSTERVTGSRLKAYAKGRGVPRASIKSFTTGTYKLPESRADYLIREALAGLLRLR